MTAKPRRPVYTDNMARDLWTSTEDKAIKAICSDAIYRKDMQARAEVLRLYAKLR